MYINVVIFFQLVFILYFDSLSRRHLKFRLLFRTYIEFSTTIVYNSIHTKYLTIISFGIF